MNFRLLKRDSVDNERLRTLLRGNTIGTPGKSLLYQHQVIDEKLDHIQEPLFVSAGFKDQVLGTICLCRRPVYLHGKPLRGYYVRYFTFRKGLRANTDKGHAVKKRDGPLIREIHGLFDGAFFKDKEPHIYYAYIDPDNVRSIRLACSFGFQKAGSFSTLFYSRLFPKRNNKVSRTDPGDPQVLGRIKEEYSDHNLLSFENIGYQDHFYGYWEGEEMVAVLQASPEHWKVLSLPGFGGRRILQLISVIPVLNKMFGSDFRFLSVEAVVCKEGRSDALDKLLNDVLARFNLVTAVMCLDPGSKAYRMMNRLNRGLMGKMVRPRSFDLMVRTHQVEIDTTAPCYVSAFDVM